jgi:hypothetical protein
MPAIAPDNGAMIPNSVMAPTPMPAMPAMPAQGGGGASQLQRLTGNQPTPINTMPMGPQFIPTMEQTTTAQNQTTTQGLDKASQERYQAAEKTGKEAIAERQKFDVKKAEAEALSKEEMASIIGEQADEKEALREQQKQAQMKAEEDLRKSADEALKFDFDQNRVWKRMGTGSSIAAGIGIALGALAQGFGAKSNAALDVMDKQIQRDIDQQKMEYDKIKDKAKAQESAYGRLRQMGLDDMQAQDAIHKQAIEQARLGIEAGFLKTMGPEEAFAKSKEAVAKLEADNAKNLETKFNKTTGSTTTTQKGMKAVGVGALTPKEQVELAQSADKDAVIKPYRDSKTALGEFASSIDASGNANPVAVAAFISSTTGLNQGSYNSKEFSQALTSMGLTDDYINKIRSAVLNKKPLDKTITTGIQNLLQARIKNTEGPARRRYAETYARTGLGEENVLGPNVSLSTAPRDNF